MSTASLLRTTHRWLSLTFTVGVVVNFFAWRHGTPAAWVTGLALVPLAILLLSGMYLFVQPYLRRRS